MRKALNNDFVVSLGFADYLHNCSGMPKVIMEHQQMFNNAGISYVYLFSVKKNILHDRAMLFCKFGLIIDGEFCGIYQMSQILGFIERWAAGGKAPLDLHIHHLLYVDLERARELMEYLKDVPKKVFLHDYYNACVNYNLRRNGAGYCGGHGLNDRSCADCASYQKSLQIQQKLHRLYGEYLERLTFVSPSQATREIFLRFHPEYAERTIVIPHQEMIGHYRDNLEPIAPDEPIRVAYLGMPAAHKGWDTWLELQRSVPAGAYEFYVFNSAGIEYEGMTTVPVAFSGRNLDAMTAALRSKGIHIAMLWATCPETYSYTCFEAFAANAFLVTGINSGNVADVVRDHGNGIVLENDAALLRFLGDPGQVREAVNRQRRATQGGPLELRPNQQIVRLTKDGSRKAVLGCAPGRAVNYPLLWLLRWLYLRQNRKKPC